MTDLLTAPASGAASGRSRSRRPRRGAGGSWLGLVPFAAFVTLSFVVPIGFVIVDAFRKTETIQPRDAQGNPLRDPVTQQFVTERHSSYTLDNLSASLHGVYHTALVDSIELSALTAVIGTVCGVLLAYAVVSGKHLFKMQQSAVISKLRNLGVLSSGEANARVVKPGLVNLIPKAPGRFDASRRNISIR